MPPGRGRPPIILLTLAVAGRSSNPAVAERKNALYVESVARHGGTPIVLDGSSSSADRDAAFAAMDGLLLTGGADVEPARYGQEVAGALAIDADRDALEAEAWAAADRRALPVLGICRGLQAMNVFAGGSLLQHVEGHEGPSYGSGAALTHPMRVVPGTKLARILFPTNVGGGVVTVNSYHHQAVRARDLAPAFAACGLSASAAGDIVEALEAPRGPFRMAVQCHPERLESTPRQFERLFAFFVDACRGPIGER